MHFELLSPDRRLAEGEAEAVSLRSAGGDIAFLAGHVPYEGVVDICLAHVRSTEGGELRAGVHGGFVEVTGDSVVILANVAELAGEVDAARARRALEAAEGRLAEARATGDASGVRREKDAVARAQVRLELAGG